jgi:hypothetical protein
MPTLLEQLFFLPADWALLAVATYSPPLADLLGIGEPPYRSVFAGGVAAIAWLLSGLAIAVAFHYLREWDRVATRRIVQLFEGLARALRIARRSVQTRLRPSKPRDHGIVVEAEVPVELATIEVAILKQLVKLSPGYVSTMIDVARALRLRVDQVRKPLDSLYKKRLVVRTIADGDRAYALSPDGRATLMMRQSAPRG